MKSEDYTFLFIFSLIGSLVGVVIIACPIFRYIIVRCSYDEVDAECVRIHYSQSYDEDVGTTTDSNPIWEYIYNGNTYRSSMGRSVSMPDITEGTEKKIYVCPEKPEKIYVPDKNQFYILYVGIPWLVVFLGVTGLAAKKKFVE